MEFSLRPAVIHDLEVFLKWIGDQDQLRMWGGPRLSYPPEGMPIWVAITGEESMSFTMVDRFNKIAGFGQVLFAAPNIAHLARIIISPERRGCGLGRLLCHRLMAEAGKRNGLNAITLKVYRENTQAVSLCPSLGFGACSPEVGSEPILMKLDVNAQAQAVGGKAEVPS